jgi:RNA polymerase sigma factor (sigma-70 family)
MSIPSEPEDVKRLVSLISRERNGVDRALQELEAGFGPADWKSPLLSFDRTRYYEREMGAPLVRRFVAFQRLMRPEEIVGDEVNHPEHMRRLIDDERKTQVVQRALSKLTPKQRRVVELHYWEDMRQVAIAERMDVSRPAISQLLRRALDQLESILSVRV